MDADRKTSFFLKTDPLARTSLAPALGRAGGGDSPRPHGRGLGVGGSGLNKKRQALGPRCLSPHKSPSQRVGGVVGGFERAKSAWWMALFFGRGAGRPGLPGTCQVVLLARSLARSACAAPVPARSCGRRDSGGWLARRSPCRHTRQRRASNNLAQPVRSGGGARSGPGAPPISPALPCLARTSAAGGSAGFKSS